MGRDRSKLEEAKEASDYLRGGLAEELADDEPGFSSEAAPVLKFHGIYQQDDRDVRRERARQGLGKDLICMVRAAVPGGVLTAEQYLAMDALAGELASGSLRVTTRQGIQYHFVRKGDLRELVGTLNRHLVTTLAGCGDNVRNVMCCPAPPAAGDPSALADHARELSRHLKPATDAYWQLWVDGERAASLVAADGSEDGEPLYGPTYLPRKFKVALAHPDHNCVDVYTNDIGVVPHPDADGAVEAFTLLVGGGLGMTHKKPETYPRLADPLCTIAPEDLVEVCQAIVAVQRDHGDRVDRSHARMKYLVAEQGLAWFHEQVAARTDARLEPPRELAWHAADDHLGWFPQGEGRWWLGVRIPNGRIRDEADGAAYRTALRRVVERFGTGVRLTPRQDVLLTDVDADDRPAVEDELRAHGVPLVGELTAVQRHALACPALPTCGLAISEAERVAGDLVARIDAQLADVGLPGEEVHVRVTGCPNGCARPYSTEIGIVGQGKDRYALFLGGDRDGTRLTTTYAEQVPLERVPAVLDPVFSAYRDERAPGEAFGEFCHRAGVERLRERFAPDGELARRRASARAGSGAGRR